MVGTPLGHGLEAVRLLLPPHRDCFSRDAVRSGAEPEGPAGGLLFVAVDERVAPLTSASKPCLQVSPHTAPQLLSPCHGYVASVP